MAAALSLANPSHRARVHRRLVRRNAVVGALRILVPLAGAVLLAYLLASILIASLTEGFSSGGIRLEQDRLVIDIPRYEGVTPDGTTYRVVAREAFTLLTEADVIDLRNVSLEVTRPDGLRMQALADQAFYDLLDQTVEVPGQMQVIDSRQTEAILVESFVDWSAQTLTTTGEADVTFADGTALKAQSLVYYAGEDRWDMAGVELLTPADENSALGEPAPPQGGAE